MEKPYLLAQEEEPQRQSSSFSSPSFVNTHLSLTKVVRRYSLPVRLKGVDSWTSSSFYLGRVPLNRRSPRIQQAKTDSTLCFLFFSNLFGDIGLLLACPSYSRRRVLGTATAAGRHTSISERFSVCDRARTVSSLLRKPFVVEPERAAAPPDHFV